MKDSLISGTIIYGVAALYVLSGKPEYNWLGLLLFTIGGLQFVDALLWSTQENWPARYVAPIVLAMEPLVAYACYVGYYNHRMPFYEIMLACYAGLFIFQWIAYCRETTVTEDGYLKWCGYNITALNKILFLLLVLIPMLFFPNKIQATAFITITVSAWIYNFNHEAWGSRWCYSTVFFALFSLLIFLIQK